MHGTMSFKFTSKLFCTINCSYCSRIYITDGGFTVEIVCYLRLTEKRVLIYSDVVFVSTQGHQKQNYLRASNYVRYFFFLARVLQWAQAYSSMTSRDHTQAHLIRQESSRRVIGPSHRPPHDNTQHSQRTDIHVPRRDSNP